MDNFAYDILRIVIIMTDMLYLLIYLLIINLMGDIVIKIMNINYRLHY